MAYGRQRRGGGRATAGQPAQAEYKKVASVSLWETDGRGRNQPVLNGTIQMEDGREYRISLWDGESDHERAPQLTGTITQELGGRRTARAAPSQRDAAPAPEPAYDPPADQGGFDDDIPF